MTVEVGAINGISYNERYWLLNYLTKQEPVSHYNIFVKLSYDVSKIERIITCLNQIIKNNEIFSLSVESSDSLSEPLISYSDNKVISSDFHFYDISFNDAAQVQNIFNKFLEAQRITSFQCSFFEFQKQKVIGLSFHKMFFNVFMVYEVIEAILNNYSNLSINTSTFEPRPAINKEYWSKIFNDDISNIQLPFVPYLDRKRTNYRMRHKEVEIPIEFIHLANQRECAFVFTALNCLMHKYSRQKQLILGVELPYQEKASSLKGDKLFPFLFEWNGESSFAEKVKQVEEEIKLVESKHFYPFEQLLKEFNYSEKSLDISPRFQILFSFIPDYKIDHAFYEIIKDEESSFDVYDLHFILCQRGEGKFSFFFKYNEKLFQDEIVNRISSHISEIFHFIATNPHFVLNELNVLPNSEKKYILENLALGKKNDKYLGKCLTTLFEEAVAVSKNKTAIVHGNKKISYENLNAYANQIARYIQCQGVVPGSLVGVCMERSIDAMAALLGIMKAGCAYVPIDPSLPMDRIIYMMEDSKVQLLVTKERFGLAMPVFWSNVICIDLIEDEIRSQEKTNLNLKTSPQDLCYIIYTSGSTGQPKGAMLHHEGVANRILWGIDHQLSGKDDVILQKTTLSFDVSVWEIFGTLLSGSLLVLIDSEKEKNTKKLVDLIREHKVSHLDFVPSLLKVFLEQKNLSKLKSLKRITAAGETLTIELQNEALKALSCKLYNLYGPTEASLAVTYWECDPEYNGVSVPIGRPMDNTEVYILDENRKLLPLGLIGEIYIGGICVGKGYLNKREISEERFIESPFNSETKLYRTGDLGRYREDGTIEFLGRVDQQVKIRGYRIELEEIEATAEAHRKIDVAAIVVEGDDIHRRILGYIVLDKKYLNQQDKVIFELQDYLKAKLPSYMVPSEFMIVNSIPLSHNGKKDKKMLPEFKVSTRTAFKGEPLNANEEKVLAAFRQVLQTNKVIDLNESFFDAGGNSLLLVRLINSLETEFQVEIELFDVINHLTVKKLGVYIAQKNNSKVNF